MNLNIIKEILIQYYPMILRGALATLYISIISTIFGFIIGLVIGVIKTVPTSKNKLIKYSHKVLNFILSIYIEVFRGTPMIVQAMVIYYGSALAFNIDMNKMFAAFLIVSLNTGAYMSEIVRGGIESIEKGQFEASYALGMSHTKAMIYVIIPQVIRNILPATGNEFVINIKDTSVLSVISVTELFFQTKSVAGATFSYFESFFVASIIYLIMTLSITQLLKIIERKIDGPKDFVLHNHSDIEIVNKTYKQNNEPVLTSQLNVTVNTNIN